MIQVVLDPGRNRARAAGGWVYGRGRYECLALSELVRAAPDAITAAQLQAALRSAGQRTPLDRTGIRRLFAQLAILTDALLGEGAFRSRVLCAPRHQTIGPWRWSPQSGEQWALGQCDDVSSLADDGGGALLAKAAIVAPCHAETQAGLAMISESDSDALRVAALAMAADRLSAEGRLRDAERMLRSALQLGCLTHEICGVLELRLARVLKRCGRYGEAAELAALVARRARRRGFPDPSQYALGRQLQRRIVYDSDPLGFGARDPGEVPAELLTYPDPRVLGESANLEALVARRAALSDLERGGVESAHSQLREAWKSGSSALYWAISLSDHEAAENYAFNLGLIQASLHDCGDGNAVVRAFEAYRLGLQIRDDFMVGKDSVWDQLFVSNLWLDHPERRAEFNAVLSFERFPLARPEFYQSTLREAKHLTELRQIIFACVNLWRFGAEVATGQEGEALKRLARKELREATRGQGNVLDGMRRSRPLIFQAILGE